ncbi:MAG: hypothetical protein JWN21_778 [Sphingomonas bacterium]|uniref:hypothetical protein n=1 Tax=Sphingomonas bacterium TaxID=1895847 RepID=UPI00261F938D|nr:hypothetical protein [Sphingomonas bacterium]MDB5695235.1 hypothetical protein [Sphingomonas bacterium]
MLRLALIAALTAAPSLAAAQEGTPPERIRNVQVAKGQTCPKGAPGEVVVCSTLEDPFRIPSALRDTGPIASARQSWVNRAADIDQTSKIAGGLPDTCSPIGTGGQSGCFQANARAWAAERRAAANGQATE